MGKAELIRTICAVLKQYPYVVKAELFGSRQRGDAQPQSDIDLIVRFDSSTRPKGLGIYDVELALEDKLGMPVDVVQEHLIYDFVRDGIGNEREVVYEKAL